VSNYHYAVHHPSRTYTFLCGSNRPMTHAWAREILEDRESSPSWWNEEFDLVGDWDDEPLDTIQRMYTYIDGDLDVVVRRG
jgi:hypothetical protein